MTTNNRTNEPTRAQVEAAAAAIYFEDCGVAPDESIKATDDYGSAFRELARAALEAAVGAAPQAPSIDRVREVIEAHSVTHYHRDYGHGLFTTNLAEIAEALAAPVQPSSTVDEAALIREAKAEALEDAVGEVEDLIDGYQGAADEMRNRCEWGDSNRYSKYAAGMNMAAGKLRARAAEYREGSET